MKFKHLAQMFLSLCLAVQLNFAEANKNYDEEITLPVGTNFDLEMEEITRYEYDGNYVKAQTVNGKEQFILQKVGDTIINVIMEENGQKTEMRVLVHIVTEQQFNGTEPAKEAPKTTTPAKTTQNKPAATTSTVNTAKPSTTTPAKTTAPTNTTKPAASTQAKPAASTTSTNADKPTAQPSANGTPAPSVPGANTPAKTEATSTPAANTPAKAEIPAATAPAKTEATATAVTEPAKVTAPVQAEAPKAPASTIYGTPVSRPANVTPTNTIEAAKQKAENLAFDVLDLVNAERTKAGLTPLTMTKDLIDTALVRCKEIPKRFSHTRPDNTRYFTAMTMQGSVREENIAAGQTTAEAVVKAWLAAPNSKEIILNPAFRELGVGYFETVGASYGCYWVQIFRG